MSAKDVPRSDSIRRDGLRTTAEAELPPPRRTSETFLVDAHVHLHPDVSAADILDHARRNFAAGARGSGLPEDSRGVLLLTEMAGVSRFDELHERAGRGEQAGRGEGTGDWSFSHTGEEGSLEARHTSGDSILVVAGRQIAVERKLEVLALCTTEHFPEGGTLHETLAAVNAAGAVPVIPWGFGKWWGARGRLVGEALEDAVPGSLLLGDNGGRPRGSAPPRMFALGGRVGIPVLAGSDPLPLPEHLARAGAYGSLIPARGQGARAQDPGDPGDITERPAEWLRHTLRSLRTSPPTFGTRSSFPDFAREQIRLRRTLTPAVG